MEICTQSRKTLTFIVDEDTYKIASKYRWLNVIYKNGRVFIYSVVNGKMTSICKILFCDKRNYIVLHKNSDPLDFRRKNLEILSRQDYSHKYRSNYMKSNSKYPGVSFDKNTKKWKARIIKNNKVVYEKYYMMEEEAAIAVAYTSHELYGENCYTNNLSIEELTRKKDELNIKYGSNRTEIKSKSTQGCKRVKSISKYVGISYDKRRKKWSSRVKYNRKYYWCGYHSNEIEAAKAYNKKALELFGKYAKINII